MGQDVLCTGENAVVSVGGAAYSIVDALDRSVDVVSAVVGAVLSFVYAVSMPVDVSCSGENAASTTVDAPYTTVDAPFTAMDAPYTYLSETIYPVDESKRSENVGFWDVFHQSGDDAWRSLSLFHANVRHFAP